MVFQLIVLTEPGARVPGCHLRTRPPPRLPCLPRSVMIFEVTEPGFPADQAVRIFVQFERVEEATKVGSEPVCSFASAAAVCAG